ncbi:MAG: DUF362 domain-containing protein [Promethearchaeota archaeon]
MKKSVVSIKTGEDTYNTTIETLDLLKEEITRELDRAKEDGKKSILIKPNLLSTDENFACNTSAEHCAAIADFLSENSEFEIFLGDGTTYDRGKNPSTMRSLKNHGFDKYRDKWTLVDLHADDLGRWFPIVNDAPEKIELAFSKLASESFVVSAAKFKTHDVLGVTLGLKNMMGALIGARWKGTGELIRRGDVKGFMHGFSDRKPHKLTREQNVGPSKVYLAANLVRMTHCLKPDLAVIDGSTVMEGPGPRRGTVCRDLSNIFLASTDVVAVDAACAAIIKLPLEKFKYIKKSGEIGLGTHNLEEIVVRGDSIEKNMTDIEFHPRFSEAKNWTSQEEEHFSTYLKDLESDDL